MRANLSGVIRSACLWSSACALLCAVLGAQAQEDRKGREREALRRLQAQTQQLGTQVQTLEAERGKLAEEAAAKAKALDGLKGELQKRTAAEGRLRTELKTRIAKVTQDLAKLEARLADTVRELDAAKALGAQQQATLAERDQALRAARAQIEEQREIIARQSRMLTEAAQKNAELAGITRSVLGRYRDKGVMDALLQKEPFTRIEKVRVHNALQEFEEKIDAQRLALPTLGN